MTLRFRIRTGVLLLMGIIATTAAEGQIADDGVYPLVGEYETKVAPLEKAAALAWWNANVSGKDADFQAKEDAQNRLDAALADHAMFDQLKLLKGKVKDPILARETEVLYLLYLEKQADPALVAQDHGQGERRREGVQRLSPRSAVAS